MAHYFIFPEKDTTIYSHPTRQSENTGIDEIVTIRDEESFTDANYYPSRILIQFKNQEINNVINNVIGVSNTFTASLKLFQTEHRELSIDQHLEIYPLAESWVNGTGRLGNLPQITDGASWLYRDGSDNALKYNSIGTKWSTGSPCAMVPVDLNNHHGVVQEKTVRCASRKYSTPWRQVTYKYGLKWIKVR